MLDQKWVMPTLAGLGLGVIGTLLYVGSQQAPKSSSPSVVSAVLTPGASPTGTGGTTNVGPVAPNGTVQLTLPAGASWSTATTPNITGVAAGTAMPTGNQMMTLNAGTASFSVICYWTDSSGVGQITTVNVTVQ
jgi:hypothetical protein